MKFLAQSFFILLLLGSFQPAFAEYLVMTGNYPPFSYNKGLHVGGVSVDAFTELMKVTDTPFNPKKVKLVAWKDAYAIAKKHPNCVLLNVPRTPEVEDSFKWVGPLCFPKFVLVGTKKEKFLIAETEDSAKYSVGAIRGSDASRALLKEGLEPTSLEQHTTHVQPLLRLKKGELDLVAHSDFALAYLMQKMRIDTNQYRIAHTYKRIPLYFAFSKNTDDALIKQYNNVLASYTVSSFNGESAFSKALRKHLRKGRLKQQQP